MRICFHVACGAGMLALALQAADLHQVTSVVRADPHTGRLVRSMVVSGRTVHSNVVAPKVVPPSIPETEPAEPGGAFEEAVARIASRYQLPVSLIHSVIQVESNYNPYAVSSKGALGLMQLVPGTARRFGVRNVFNPVDNLQGGARYLKYLLDLFHGDYPLALAAYNAGEGAVFRYGGVPPFAETRNYLAQVRHKLEMARRSNPPRRTEVQPIAVQPVGAYNRIHEEVRADGKVYYVSH